MPGEAAPSLCPQRPPQLGQDAPAAFGGVVVQLVRPERKDAGQLGPPLVGALRSSAWEGAARAPVPASGCPLWALRASFVGHGLAVSHVPKERG